MTFKIKSLALVSFLLLVCNPLYSQQENNTTKASCFCTTETERPKRYVPPLNLLFKYNAFKKATSWRLENGETDFNNMYFSNMHSNSSSYSGNQLSLIIFSTQPIKVTHPKYAFTLNITPCNNANNYYAVETYYGENLPLDYSFKNFNYSAEDYFKVMQVIRNYYNTEAALKAFWLKTFEYDAESFISLINSLNSEYSLTIKPELTVDEYEGFIDNLEEKINEIFEAFNKNDVNIYNFTLKKYIITDNETREINVTEEKNIAAFFYDYRSVNFSKIWVDVNYLRGRYSGYFITKEIALELHSDIISTNDSHAKTSILLSVNNVSFYNTENLSIKIKNDCNTTYKIANTDIQIVFKTGTITAPSLIDQTKNKTGTTSNFNSNETSGQTSREIANFSGLVIQDSQLIIPYKNRNIDAVGDTLFLNNNLFSGRFHIVKSTTNLSPKKIEKHLTKLGLKNVTITEQGDLYSVYFKNLKA